jgi:hypothetical protein
MPITPTTRKIYQSLAAILREVRSVPLPPTQAFPRGTIITFYYGQWKHNPYPTLIVTDSYAPRFGIDGMLRGVNLNYLSFGEVKKILDHCGNTSFSYGTLIRDGKLAGMRRAFRRYRWNQLNIPYIMRFDNDEIKEKAGIVEAYDPVSAMAMKEQIRQQLAIPTGQQTADQLAGQQQPQGQQMQFPFMQGGQQTQFPFMDQGE